MPMKWGRVFAECLHSLWMAQTNILFILFSVRNFRWSKEEIRNPFAHPLRCCFTANRSYGYYSGTTWLFNMLLEGVSLRSAQTRYRLYIITRLYPKLEVCKVCLYTVFPDVQQKILQTHSVEWLILWVKHKIW